MNGAVITVAQVADEGLRAVVGERIADLQTFYAPLGITGTEHAWHPGTRLIADRTSFVHQRPSETLWIWGERLPAGLGTAEALLGADDSDLQAIAGMTAAFAFGRERARVVSSASGPATLYEAQGDGIWCCSTHAVAAAWVAHGDAHIDPTAVPELLAFDFVGGERTLIAGARHLPPATDIQIEAGRRRAGVSLSDAQRWQPLPEPDAQSHAEDSLLGSIESRVAGQAVSVALTAGLDSRVLAVALHEIGAPFDAFTWGAAGWPDTEGAAEVANALGARHEVFGLATLAGHQVLPEHDRAVRWSDGVFALAPAARTWPSGADSVASGMGGETGRAFYYDDWSAWLWPDPPHDVLADRLSGRAHLPAARPEAVAHADGAVASWLGQAEESGLTGWRLLDVVYTDQRVRRWGRGQVPCVGCSFTPAFTPHELARALVSQPLPDRLRSAFHHRFLATRRPDLALPQEATPSMPPSFLRQPHRTRQRSRRARRIGRPPRQPADAYVARTWAECSAARDWVLEHVLVHPLTGGLLGQAWVDWVHEDFPRGARRAGEHARLAAGVVALESALGELRRSRRSSAT